MEASRFGFDKSLPPAFKFEPTDADLIAFYLLPRALNISNPHKHAVKDADPGSCPPWELLRRHGHAGSDHAFFFGPPRKISEDGSISRAVRVVPAGEEGVPGKWRGQQGKDKQVSLKCHGGGEVVVTYKKYHLTYYNVLGVKNGKEELSGSGWVMEEYIIVDPPLNPAAVLARVKVAERATKKHREKRKAAAAAAQVVPSVQYQEEQPGPSNYYHHHCVDGEVAGTSSSAQVFVAPEAEGSNDMEEPVVNYTDELLHSGEAYLDGYNNYVFRNNYVGQGYDDAGSSNYKGGSNYGYDNAAATYKPIDSYGAT